MTTAELKKLGIENAKDLNVKAPYAVYVEFGNTTAHDFVKKELVEKLKKDGYFVEEEDFHAGGLGKSGGVRLFYKDFSNGKSRENTYYFPSAMESLVESWKLSDRTLLKELKCFDSEFKHYIENLKKTLKKCGRKGTNIELSENTKAYLVSIGYSEDDFKQIEDAMNQSTFAIFLNGEVDRCKIVTPKEAKKLLGEEMFAGVVARSAFHFSASQVVPNTMGEYILDVDSGEMLGGSPSLLKEKNTLQLCLKDLVAYQQEKKDADEREDVDEDLLEY